MRGIHPRPKGRGTLPLDEWLTIPIRDAMTSDTLFSTVSTRSPLRYPGGKSRAVRTLAAMLPRRTPRTVVSPFVGGGSFELYLTSLGCEVHAFDGYEPLVAFWDVLLSQPAALEAEVASRLPVTPEGFKSAQAAVRSEPPGSVEQAANYFVVNRTSFSGATMSGGFSPQAAEGRLTVKTVERLGQFSNTLLSVRHALFEESLQRDAGFVFADPPYLLSGQGNKLYGTAGDMHESFDHVDFHAAITAVESPWLITYNDCPEVRELYAAFDIVEAEWAYGMNKSKQSSEIVIRNYQR